MRLVEYCDAAEPEKLIAACVSVFSFRINGRLPDTMEYILYCPDVKQASENVLVSKIFTKVDEPPIQDYIDSNYQRINALDNHFNRATWAKFACWVQTPCDGEPVFHADYDTLCFGSIMDAIPKISAVFSGRINKGHDKSCNGGFYCKVSEFDRTDAGELMLAPIYNNEIFEEAKKIWRYSDEIGIAWYFQNRGFAQFYELDWRFNMPVMRQKMSLKSIEKNDIRVLHYLGSPKPWDELAALRYKHQQWRWLTMKERMYNELEIR